MAKLTFEVPHSLPVEAARPRVEALLAYWQRRYGVRATWEGTQATLSGKALGVSFEGRLQVLAGRISGEATDPGLLLRGQAQKYLTRKFHLYLDPAKTLEQVLASEAQ